MAEKQKNTIQVGKKGEDIAVGYLSHQGVSVFLRNVRTPYGEIDIIGEDNGCLIFVEVKARRNQSFGFPEEAVHARKQEHMVNSAIFYLQENFEEEIDWRIDVIAVNFAIKDESPQIRRFKNAIIS